MSKSLTRVRSALMSAGVAAEILEMRSETRTAKQAAQEAQCHLDQIAKSIVFLGETTGQLLLFITAGGNRIDTLTASDLAGQPLGKADAAFVRTETGFAIGGVAPVGHLNPPTAFFDARLLDFETVWAAAGTPRHIFPIAPAVLLKISNAQLSDFTK